MADRIAQPTSEAECAEIVAEAASRGDAFEIVGGGSRAGLGRPVAADRILSTAKLSGVSLYEPGAMTIVAKAGTPLREIEETLATENQRLPFEPTDLRSLYGTADKTPTIGGVVATGAAGPRRIQAGGCRDSLIGVRFVNGAGEAIKSGGRVMKDVTGYDLVKLSAGANGTLGVLTEVAFKVLPKPEKTATLLLPGLDDLRAVGAMSAALGSPYDVTGAAHLPVGMDGAPVTMIRLEGFAASVDYRAEKLRGELADFAAGSIETDPQRTAAGWAWVRDAQAFAGREGAVWRVTVKPSDGPALVAAIRGATALDGAFYDWGGGLVWLLVPDKVDAGAKVIRSETAKLGGAATLIRAADATRRVVSIFPPQPAPLEAVAAGLRSKFDPAGVLNPGRMAP